MVMRGRGQRALFLAGALTIAFALAAPIIHAADTPRRGGVLLAVIGADPPSLDPHQESTFATIQLVAPLYSTLLQTDPYDYPKIIGDAASEWKISPDAPLVAENERLQRDNRRLTARLRQAETIIEVQKKLSEILGIPLPPHDSNGSTR